MLTPMTVGKIIAQLIDDNDRLRKTLEDIAVRPGGEGHGPPFCTLCNARPRPGEPLVHRDTCVLRPLRTS